MITESERFARIFNLINRIQTKLQSVIYLNTTLRGLFAILLGIALLFQPDKTRPMLVSFMGGFWFAGGVLSLRWSGKNRQSRWLGLVIGIVGVVAGLAVMARPITSRYIAEMVRVNVLAVLMILTGMIHIGGGPVGEEIDMQRWRRSAPILGLIEIVLGILLLLAQDMNFSLTVYYLATLWAFVGGIILFGNALRQRRRARNRKQVDDSS